MLQILAWQLIHQRSQICAGVHVNFTNQAGQRASEPQARKFANVALAAYSSDQVVVEGLGPSDPKQTEETTDELTALTRSKKRDKCL